jgi:hypothetical protein
LLPEKCYMIKLLHPEASSLVFYLDVKNLRSSDLRLTVGGPLLCSLIVPCVSQYL